MTSFTFPCILPIPVSARFTSSCQFPASDEFSSEDHYEHTPRYVAEVFDGSTPNVPWLNERSSLGRRQFPEYQMRSARFDKFLLEILYEHRASRRQSFSIDENREMREPSSSDYMRFCGDHDTIPYAPSIRSSPEICLPGLSEVFFGRADVESHRSPRKRRRRGGTFEQDLSEFPEAKLFDREEPTTGISTYPFVYCVTETAEGREKFQRETSTDWDDQDMDQSSGESYRQRMQHEDFDYEEPDPCPEKYRDPLWEEHVKSEESTARSAKGKEKAYPPDPFYLNSYSGSEKYLSQPYNIPNESGHTYARGSPLHNLPSAEESYMKRTAHSPQHTYFHSGSPSKAGAKAPKRHVNYSRNFNSPYINRRDPYALSPDELKRARQVLQRDRVVLNAAMEWLTSEELQFDADCLNAGYPATDFSAFTSYFQRATGLLSKSNMSYQSSGEYGMRFGKQSSCNYPNYDEPCVEGDLSSISSYSPNMPQSQRLDEARQMLDRYDRAWEVLDIRDANVPYPTPSGMANDLNDPNKIYSPWTSAPTTWARDKVMQVNAETFYQRAFGIRPIYSEFQGAVRTLEGLPTATDKQLRQLEDFLKKERHRWHPDKLLLRSGEQGSSSSNTLMTSPASRAVLQAVNDLLQACREELARRTEIYQNYY